MRNIKKIFTWVYMLTKKHLYRWSFPFLMVVIICSAPLMSHMLGDDDTIMKIAVFAGEDEYAKEVAKNLMNDDSVITYIQYDSEEEATNAVKRGKCESAWIFDEDFSEGLLKFVEGKFRDPIITVVEREENIALRLSREKLYGKVFPRISYNIYRNYVRNEIGGEDKISEERLRETYDNMERRGSTVKIKIAGSDAVYDIKGESVLLSPLRGFLAILIMLCGLGAGLYFIKEREDGVYARMDESRLYIPAFGSCFGAVLLSAVAACLSMLIAGFFNNPVLDVVNILLFVVGAGLFCTLFSMMFKKVTLFGALIPPFVILMLIMCPIFFNVHFAGWIKYLLPPYYYLMAVYNVEYMWYSLVYILTLGVGLWGVSALKKS